MCVQVLPASVDLYTPLPITSASRMAQASPVPAHTTFGIRPGHGQRADRLDRLIVEDRFQGLAAVGRLPDAAGRRAGVVGPRVARDARDGREAAGAGRAHVAEPQGLRRLTEARTGGRALLRVQPGGDDHRQQQADRKVRASGVWRVHGGSLRDYFVFSTSRALGTVSFGVDLVEDAGELALLVDHERRADDAHVLAAVS